MSIFINVEILDSSLPSNQALAPMSRVAFQEKHVKKVFVCVEQQVAVPTKRLGATAKLITVNANVQSMLKPVPREKNVKTECVVSDALLIYLLFFISF